MEKSKERQPELAGQDGGARGAEAANQDGIRRAELASQDVVRQEEV